MESHLSWMQTQMVLPASRILYALLALLYVPTKLRVASVAKNPTNLSKGMLIGLGVDHSEINVHMPRVATMRGERKEEYKFVTNTAASI